MGSIKYTIASQMKHFDQNLYSFHVFRIEWGVVEGEVKGGGGEFGQQTLTS